MLIVFLEGRHYWKFSGGLLRPSHYYTATRYPFNSTKIKNDAPHEAQLQRRAAAKHFAVPEHSKTPNNPHTHHLPTIPKLPTTSILFFHLLSFPVIKIRRLSKFQNPSPLISNLSVPDRS